MQKRNVQNSYTTNSNLQQHEKRNKFRILLMRTLALSLILICSLIQTKAQTFEWAINMGGDKADQGFNTAIDSKGNVYITGRFSSTAIDFSPGPIFKTLGSDDIFLAKYDPAGKCLWAKQMGGTSLDQGWAIAIDGNDNVYITGYFIGDGDFNIGGKGGELESINWGIDAFVAKYDSDGNFLWANSMGSKYGDMGQAIAVDNKGNVYVTGVYNDTINFNENGSGGIVLPYGKADIFLVKYDSTGNYVWAKGMGGTGNDYGNGIAVDGNSVYVTGYIDAGTSNFDGNNIKGQLNSMGGTDIFLARYDLDGNYSWAINVGGSGTDFGYSVVVDKGSNVYITGYFNSLIANFDPVSYKPINVAGTRNAFLAKYDSTGKYIWAHGFGDTKDGQGWKLATDASSNVYVTGSFPISIKLNPANKNDSLKAVGGQVADVFLAKYDSAGNYLWAKAMGGDNDERGRGVNVDRNGNVYITGYFNSTTAAFNSPNSSGVLTSAGNYDIFLAKFSCSDTSSSYSEVTLACGGTYDFNGITCDTSGIYVYKTPNIYGCDSTVTLNLTILEVVKPVVRVTGFVLSIDGDPYKTYQWIKDGTDIPGATEATYTITENGNYQVRVTNEKDCEVTSDVYPVTNVAVEDYKLSQQITIYPNPARNMIHINSPVSVNIMIKSVDGRNVLFADDAVSIPVSNLAQGIYLLHLMDKHGSLIKVEKIIKE